MRRHIRWFTIAVVVVGLAALGLPTGPAVANHNADLHSANLTLVKTLAKTGVVNSDLAFWGNRAYAGYLSSGSPGGAGAFPGGFRIIDITDPPNATVITDFVCWGSQNDVSVYNNDADAAADLLFLSVDGPRTATAGAPSCTDPATTGANAAGWEGIRIFDINDEKNPIKIADVPLDCGSHTHTLVPGKGANAGNLYIYNSSYPLGVAAVTTGIVGATPAENGLRTNGTDCLEPEPGEAKQNGYHNKISIVTVPLSNPAAADDFTGVSPTQTYTNVKEVALEGATHWTHRYAGPTPTTPARAFDFTACHDIAVFVAIDLAAASCWAEGQLWDITDPLTPDFLRRTRQDEIIDSIFHSATFTWDAKVIALEDEAGGGGDDRCRDVNDLQGRMLFYNQSANLLGTFKIPRPQAKPEICTAHNYNYVPQGNGQHILVSAWYEGGTSVIDATNPAAAKEIGYYDAQTAVPGGTAPVKSEVWSSYWYNGYIYVNDERRGLDILKLNDSRVEGAITLPRLNPQTQENLIPQVLPKCRGQAATILGTSGADTLTGTAGPDVIVGLGGADTLSGLGGGDRICGGPGKDKVNGGAGADLLSGNRGADRLSGGPGGDKLNGGPGRDRCNGGPGVDAVTKCEVIIG